MDFEDENIFKVWTKYPMPFTGKGKKQNENLPCTIHRTKNKVLH